MRILKKWNSEDGVLGLYWLGCFQDSCPQSGWVHRGCDAPPTPSNDLWLANNLNKFYCRFERQYSPAPAHQLHLLHYRKGLGLSIIALLRYPFSPTTMRTHFIWRGTLTDCLRRRTPAKQLDQTLSPPWSIVKISWLWYSSLTLNWRHAM